MDKCCQNFRLVIINFFIIQFSFSQTITIDTVFHEMVASGITYTFYRTNLPQEIHVTEIDLTNPNLTIESFRASGLVKTSEQVKLNDWQQHRVIVAINGDFFSFKDSFPVNNQIANGKPIAGYVLPNKSQFAITADGKFLFDGFSFSGSIKTATRKIFFFNRLNTTRTLNEITFYTSFRGATTKTDSGGVEIILNNLSDKITAQDTLQFVVASKTLSGNSVIPQHGAIISHGKSNSQMSFFSSFSIGDTVKIFLDYITSSKRNDHKITQLIGGWGRLLYHGKNLPALSDSNEGLTEKFTAVRHPRTFLGINSDTTKLYLCVVDGRQEKSIGMTFLEMANFLQRLRITDAINLDGGGSTTMVIYGKIVNSPSDKTGERSVANTIQIILNESK